MNSRAHYCWIVHSPVSLFVSNPYNTLASRRFFYFHTFYNNSNQHVLFSSKYIQTPRWYRQTSSLSHSVKINVKSFLNLIKKKPLLGSSPIVNGATEKNPHSLDCIHPKFRRIYKLKEPRQRTDKSLVHSLKEEDIISAGKLIYYNIHNFQVKPVVDLLKLADAKFPLLLENHSFPFPEIIKYLEDRLTPPETTGHRLYQSQLKSLQFKYRFPVKYDVSSNKDAQLGWVTQENIKSLQNQWNFNFFKTKNPILTNNSFLRRKSGFKIKHKLFAFINSGLNFFFLKQPLHRARRYCFYLKQQFISNAKWLYFKESKQLSQDLQVGEDTHTQHHPVNKDKDRFWTELTFDALDLDQKLRPPPVLYIHKQTIMTKLAGFLSTTHPGAVLRGFGSSVNGFCTKYSDIDVCYIIPSCIIREQQLAALKTLKRALNKNPQCLAQMKIKTCFLIPAQVPILKLVDNTGKECCDISINNTTALDNSNLVHLFGNYDNRVRILGRLLKTWARQRHINERADGTLSTYTLFLMLFFFLQTRHPPVLPLYSTFEKETARRYLLNNPSIIPNTGALRPTESKILTENKSDTIQVDQYLNLLCDSNGWSLPYVIDLQFIKTHLRHPAMQELNTESIGQLLSEFFFFYGSADFSGTENDKSLTINLKTGLSNINSIGHIDVSCPISGRCVNKFSKKKWEIIFNEFNRARELMLQKSSLCQLFKNGCVIPDLPFTLDNTNKQKLCELGEFVRVLAVKDNN